MIFSTDVKLLIIEFAVNVVQNPLSISCSDSYEKMPQGPAVDRFVIYPKDSVCSFDISGKTPEDTVVVDSIIVNDASVTINQVWINGVLIQNWGLEHFLKFYPAYDESQLKYAKAHNIQLPEVMTKLQPFTFNGKIEINLESFFERYHKILLNSLQGHDNWVEYNHLGMVDFSTKDQLKKLLMDL